MATATTPATPAATSALVESNITVERTDYAVGFDITTTKDAQGTETKHADANFHEINNDEKVAFVKKLIEDGKFVEMFKLTVSIPRAKNLAGIKEICPDEEEAANNFNRGAKQKANNRLASRLTDVDQDGNLVFDPEGNDKEGKPNLVNGVLDMTAEIASESKRKVLGEEEKLDRFLENFPEAARTAMKAAYLAARVQQPVAA